MTHSPADTDKPGGGIGSLKPDPTEGLRLLKAFMNITDHRARVAAIEFVESLAAPPQTTTAH